MHCASSILQTLSHWPPRSVRSHFHDEEIQDPLLPHGYRSDHPNTFWTSLSTQYAIPDGRHSTVISRKVLPLSSVSKVRNQADPPSRLLLLQEEIFRRIVNHPDFYETAFRKAQIFLCGNIPFRFSRRHILFRSAVRSFRSFHQSPVLPVDESSPA